MMGISNEVKLFFLCEVLKSKIEASRVEFCCTRDAVGKYWKKY